jgi:hypothetical protein
MKNNRRKNFHGNQANNYFHAIDDKLLLELGIDVAERVLANVALPPEIVDASLLCKGIDIAIHNHAYAKFQEYVRSPNKGCILEAVTVLLTNDPQVLQVFLNEDRTNIAEGGTEMMQKLSAMSALDKVMFGLAYELLGSWNSVELMHTLGQLDFDRWCLLHKSRTIITSAESDCQCEFCINWRAKRSKLIDEHPLSALRV